MREGPSLEDYLATGALANVPLWVYFLILSFDAGRYTTSDQFMFYNIVPLLAVTAGGFVSSYLMCGRIKKRTYRNGLIFAVSATLVNIVFSVAAFTPSVSFDPRVAFCFVVSAIVGVLFRRREQETL